MILAKRVAEIASEERGIDTSIELVENSRGNGTLVDTFDVDTTHAHNRLGWDATESIENSIRNLLAQNQ